MNRKLAQSPFYFQNPAKTHQMELVLVLQQSTMPTLLKPVT